MKPMSVESRALLEAARGREGPSMADRNRIRGKISARIAAGLALGSAVTAGATAAEAAHVTGLTSVAAWLPGLAKVVTAAAVAGGVTVGTVHVVNRASHSNSPATVTSTSPVVGPLRTRAPQNVQPHANSTVADTSSSAEMAPTPLPIATAGKMQPTTRHEPSVLPEPTETEPAPVVHAPPVDDGLAGQVSAIREARSAMRSGDGRAALVALNRAFVPGQSGPLSQEATLVRVSALCLVGDRAAARRTAEQFLANYPSSPLVSKIRSTCAFP